MAFDGQDPPIRGSFRHAGAPSGARRRSRSSSVGARIGRGRRSRSRGLRYEEISRESLRRRDERRRGDSRGDRRDPLPRHREEHRRESLNQRRSDLGRGERVSRESLERRRLDLERERARRRPSAVLLLRGVPEAGLSEERLEEVAWAAAVQAGCSMPSSVRISSEHQSRGLALVEFPHLDAAVTFRDHTHGSLEVEGVKFTMSYYHEGMSLADTAESSNSFKLDAKSGFYLDADAGLFYDPSTTYFFTTDYRKYFVYDPEKNLLCLVDSQGVRVPGGEERPLPSNSKVAQSTRKRPSHIDSKRSRSSRRKSSIMSEPYQDLTFLRIRDPPEGSNRDLASRDGRDARDGRDDRGKRHGRDERSRSPRGRRDPRDARDRNRNESSRRRCHERERDPPRDYCEREADRARDRRRDNRDRDRERSLDRDEKREIEGHRRDREQRLRDADPSPAPESERVSDPKRTLPSIVNIAKVEVSGKIIFRGGDPLAKLAQPIPEVAPAQPKKKKKAVDEVMGLAPMQAIGVPGPVTIFRASHPKLVQAAVEPKPVFPKAMCDLPRPVPLSPPKPSPKPQPPAPKQSAFAAAYARRIEAAKCPLSSSSMATSSVQQPAAIVPGVRSVSQGQDVSTVPEAETQRDWICEICMRMFNTEEALQRHEQFSELHQENMAKLRGR